MKAGEDKQVPARFPDDYAAKRVAGKDAQFALTVRRSKSRACRRWTRPSCAASAWPRAAWRSFARRCARPWSRRSPTRCEQRVREQLLELLHKANPLELPRVLVDEQVRDLQVQVLRRMGVQKIEQAAAARALRGGGAQARGARPDHRRDRARQRHRRWTAAASSAGCTPPQRAHPDPEAVRRQYLQSREAMAQLGIRRPWRIRRSTGSCRRSRWSTYRRVSRIDRLSAEPKEVNS